MSAAAHDADTSTAGLRAVGVRMEYPGTTALDGVDLDVRPGELVALLGENGAGKSTLANIVSGGTQPTEATMTWLGEAYAPADPREAMERGIAMIQQELRLLPDLSVAENVMVGRWPLRGGRVDHQEMRRVASEQLARLGYEGSVTVPVRSLSVAAQQQVEIAKALSQNAKLVILDEPTAALGDTETEALFRVIRDLKAEGVGFIYVSHRLAEIAQIADRIVVLRDGQEVAAHDHADIDPSVLVSQMVGRSVDRLYPDLPEPREEVLLSVRELTSADGRFADISFDVRAGEIFGIAGIVGAGRTELVRAIFGADPLRSGTVELGGDPVQLRGPADGMAAGMALVPEDRKEQGVVVPFTVADNLLLPNLRDVAPSGWLSPGHAMSRAAEMAERAGVKGGAGVRVGSLSGGNQQKVVLAKWLERAPRLVILDEPTRGIDVGARAGIYETISRLAEQGSAVLVVSSDLEEVIGLTHRVMVMADGAVRGILDRGEASAETVMSLATTS